MKVLVLNPNIKGIGTYRRSFYFGRELARHGHQVTLMTVSRESKYRPVVYYKRDWGGAYLQPAGAGPWIKVIEGPALGYKWLPGWGSGPLDIALRIREILSNDYDVVYGFEYHPNVSWPIYLTKALQKKYMFLSDWCDWYAGNSNRFRDIQVAQKIDAMFEERIRLIAEKVTVTSSLLKERALLMGIPPDKVVQISEGAAVEYIKPIPIVEARNHLRFPAEYPIIAAIHNGDMCLEIEIFNSVLKQSPDAYFLMIGREAPKARQLATELGIDSKIIYTGWVTDEDYPRYLACADVLFCPLRDDLNNQARWPAKILDYLCAARATVTNDVGEVGKLFSQSDIGCLAMYSVEDISEKIVGLLKDKLKREYLGQNARRIMEAEWDYRIKGHQIAKLID